MAKILIVDDRPTNRQFLVTLLGYYNHSLFEASDGVQALEAVKSEHPDLVISDILMPTMDGFEFVQHMRSDPEIRDTPVIFQTAIYSTSNAKELASSCGVGVVLPKPCEPQEILNAINHILGEGAVAGGDIAIDIEREESKVGAGQLLDEYVRELGEVKHEFDGILHHDQKLYSNPDWIREMTGRFSENVIQMQRIASRLTALVEVGTEMVLERDPAKLINIFFGAACEIIDAQQVAIGVLDEKEQHIKHIRSKHVDSEIYDKNIHEGYLGLLLRQPSPIRISRDNGIPSTEGFPKGHPAVICFLGVPVVSGDRIYGWLYFADKRGAGYFDMEDEHLAGMLAARLALFFENAFLYDVIQRHSARLQIEIVERKKIENELKQLNESLELRVVERTSALETINKELEAFSYSVSHDLQAPLRAIDGFSQALLNDNASQLDDIGKDRLKRVCAGAKNMAALINDLLTLSRITSSEIQYERVDLSKLFTEIIEEIQHRDRSRQVKISVQPGMISHGDSRLLRVAMNNLLENAWKFSKQRDVAVIDVGCNTRGNKFIYFVRDNGAGFDMIYADKLFSAFQRLHDSKEYPGTGIGLATVKRVINKHGGRVWAESTVDNGSIFYFTLNDDQGGNISKESLGMNQYA